MVLVQHALDGAQGVLMGHGHGVCSLSTAKALVVFLGVGRQQVQPLLACLHLVGGQAVHQLAHDGLRIAHQRAVDRTGIAEFRLIDIDLYELDVGVVLLAFAVAQHPVEASAHQQDDVCRAHGKAAAGSGGVGVVIGDEALGHGHGLEGDVGLVDKRSQLLLSTAQSCALANDDPGVLGALQKLQGLLHHGGIGRLGRGEVLGRDEDLLGNGLLDGLTHEVVGEVYIDAARTACHSGADGALDAQRDVLDLVDAEGVFGEGRSVSALVEALVLALLQIHRMAHRGTGQLDAGPAILGRLFKGSEAVEETGSRNGKEHAGTAGKEALGSSSVSCICLMAHTDVFDALGLSNAGEVGDGDANHAIHVLHPIGNDGVCQKMHAVGKVLSGSGRCGASGHNSLLRSSEQVTQPAARASRLRALRRTLSP